MSYNYKGKRVFISGPMTGKPGWNGKEFNRAERELRELEAEWVFNPWYFSPSEDEPVQPHEYYMMKSLEQLTMRDWKRCGGERPYFDCIVMLDGWWDSEGARVERAVAEAIGLDVIEWDEPEYL